eukprot:215616-Pyramimonas_sp.AAC.1
MLQLILLGPADKVVAAYQHVSLGVVVDDFGAHRVGRAQGVVEDLAGATAMLHAELKEVHLVVHRRKSRVVASSAHIRAQLVRRLRRFNVQGAQTDRNLGIDFAAAVCRFRATRAARRAPAHARARKIVSLGPH